MGDTTTFQAYVYHCPADQVDAALAELEAYDLQVNWGSRKTPGRLELAEPYTSHDIGVGAASDIASALIEEAPGCCFVLWEDPKYEWLGSLYAYTPELGLFSAACDAGGQPVLTRSEIAQLIADASEGLSARQGGTMLRQITEALGAATGEPWFADWERRKP